MEKKDLYLPYEKRWDCFSAYDEQSERLEKVVKASADYAVKKVIEDIGLNCYTVWATIELEYKENICLDNGYLEALKKLIET